MSKVNLTEEYLDYAKQIDKIMFNMEQNGSSSTEGIDSSSYPILVQIRDVFYAKYKKLFLEDNLLLSNLAVPEKYYCKDRVEYYRSKGVKI